MISQELRNYVARKMYDNGEYDWEVNDFTRCRVDPCAVCEEFVERYRGGFEGLIKSQLVEQVMDQADALIEQARQAGYVQGWDAGEKSGYDHGYDDGHEAADEAAFIRGWDQAYEELDQRPSVTYELYLHYSPYDAFMLCGHDNPFWLIERSTVLASVILKDMNPEIRFSVIRSVNGVWDSSMEFGIDGKMHWEGLDNGA